MHTKQFYEAPEAELLVVRFEENLMASPFTITQVEQGNTNWWEDDEED
ncbi:MAG: hypothetical protein IKX20_11485 [Paludibacteraceae bacterium]|nr:hypothetical protein [Paludibacteraceae bacterium]